VGLATLALVLAAAALAGIVRIMVLNDKLDAKVKELEASQAADDTAQARLGRSVDRLGNAVTLLSDEQVDLLNSKLQHLRHGFAVSELAVVPSGERRQRGGTADQLGQPPLPGRHLPGEGGQQQSGVHHQQPAARLERRVRGGVAQLAPRDRAHGHFLAGLLGRRVRPLSAVPAITVEALLDRYDGFLLDAYGVLVSSAGALPGAAAFLERLRRAHKPFLIVSNDASRLPSTTAARYQRFGLPVEVDRILTSGMLLADHFAAQRLAGAPTIVLGSRDSETYVRDAGGVVVPHGDDRATVVVAADDDGYPSSSPSTRW
jgi:hypothetical protein